MEVKFYEDAEDKLLEFAVLSRRLQPDSRHVVDIVSKARGLQLLCGSPWSADVQFTFDFYILICYNWGNRYLARDRRNIP